MLSFWILVAFGKTKVDNINAILCLLSATDKEVVWLDVAVDYALLVDLLDALDHLDGNQQDRLQVELALAGLEEVFERRPE